MWECDKSHGGGVKRRQLLSGLAGAGAGMATLGGMSAPAAAGGKGDCDAYDPTTAHLDTADHFETSWWGNVYLTDGNSVTNYDVGGNGFPWGTDELVVHLHGWRNEYECGVSSVMEAQSAYGSSSLDPAVTGLVWDSDYSWSNAKEIAERNAPKLARFLVDYHAQSPGSTIRLQAHSLGARVLAETLVQLDAWGRTDVVTSAVFLAGAITDDSVATDGRYGRAIENTVDHAENFWDGDDSVLNWLFSTREFSWAVGNNGCNGPKPSNYTDHDVTGQPDGHTSQYWVTADVVDSWIAPSL